MRYEYFVQVSGDPEGNKKIPGVVPLRAFSRRNRALGYAEDVAYRYPEAFVLVQVELHSPYKPSGRR